MSWHWQIRAAPAPRMSSTKGRGSPNDSITAAGRCFSTSVSSDGDLRKDQVMKPTADALAAGCGELLLEPGRVAVAAADQAKAARRG